MRVYTSTKRIVYTVTSSLPALTSLLSDKTFKGYRCESDMHLYNWKVTWNYAYCPFQAQPFRFFCSFCCKYSLVYCIPFLNHFNLIISQCLNNFSVYTGIVDYFILAIIMNSCILGCKKISEFDQIYAHKHHTANKGYASYPKKVWKVTINLIRFRFFPPKFQNSRMQSRLR